MEPTLNPQQSLQLISESLRKTKINFAESSFCFKLWGWLIATASFGSYLLLSQTASGFPYLPFPLLALIGAMATIGYYRRQRRTSRTETYINYYLNRMWLVLGVSFVLTVAVSIQYDMQPFSFTLIVAGIGTLVTGLVIQFKPLLMGAFCFSQRHYYRCLFPKKPGRSYTELPLSPDI